MREIQNIEEYREVLVEAGFVISNNAIRMPDNGLFCKDDMTVYPTIQLQDAFLRKLSPDELKVELDSAVANNEIAAAFDIVSNPDDKDIHLRISSRKPDIGMPHYRLLDLYCQPVVCVRANDIKYTAVVPGALIQKWGRTLGEVFGMVMGRQSYRYESLSSIAMPYLDADATVVCNHMYAVINKDIMFGAVVLFDSEYLEYLRMTFGDYWVLPSSVHEIIIVPVSAHKGKRVVAEGLSEIIKEVNNTEIAPNDFLSNSLYLYTNEGLKIAQ